MENHALEKTFYLALRKPVILGPTEHQVKKDLRRSYGLQVPGGAGGS